jgi:glycosyltransferase involved in cell wall biosynthesis
MIDHLSKTRRIDANKFELIRNWQNDAAFLGESENSNIARKNEFIFMYVGSLSASAGVDVIIRGFHEAKLPCSKLIIAGNGVDKQKCIAIATDLKNPQIAFCEASPEDVPELQSHADVLLLPLKKGIAKTATPSKLTAYLLSSKPIIACVEEDTDVADILREGNCGFVIEPENETALSLKMKELFHLNQDQLEQHGKNGRDFAITNLSKRTNLKKLVSLIEKLLKDNKGNLYDLPG